MYHWMALVATQKKVVAAAVGYHKSGVRDWIMKQVTALTSQQIISLHYFKSLHWTAVHKSVAYCLT